MAFGFRLVTAHFHPGKVVIHVPHEEVRNPLEQGRLISLHRQHISGPSLNDLLGNLGLATYRVDRHQATRHTSRSSSRLGGFDGPEDGVESVVQGNPVGQIGDLGQPGSFLTSPFGDCHEVVGACDHGVKWDRQNIDEWRNDLASAWVGQAGKMVFDASGDIVGYERSIPRGIGKTPPASTRSRVAMLQASQVTHCGAIALDSSPVGPKIKWSESAFAPLVERHGPMVWGTAGGF